MTLQAVVQILGKPGVVATIKYAAFWRRNNARTIR